MGAASPVRLLICGADPPDGPPLLRSAANVIAAAGAQTTWLPVGTGQAGAAAVAESVRAQRFDAVLVRGFAIAVRLAGMPSMQGRLVLFEADFPALRDASETAVDGAASEDIAATAVAAAALLCDDEDRRSRLEYALPECHGRTLSWPSRPERADVWRLLRGLGPPSTAVPRSRTLRVLVAGHFLAFIGPVLDRLARLPGREVRIDPWRAIGERGRPPDLAANAWADVVICEWCGENAVWHSRNRRPGQRLIVHLHRFELDTPYPRAVHADAVDQWVAVSPYCRDLVRRRLPHVAPERVVAVPNYADAWTFDRPKVPGARFHLGLLGAVPKRKRLDIALDILEQVRVRDERFCLFVKGHYPWSRPAWLRAGERTFYEGVFRRIQTAPLLQGAVVFDPFGGDVPNWLRKIGILLATSDAESFHVASLEAMMSRAASVIVQWPGADRVFGACGVVPDARQAAQRVLELAAPEVWAAQRQAARKRVERYELDNVFQAWARIIVADRDPDDWVGTP